ncbi:hypothetical protein E3P99_01393 [Wallemia hederae]|uniref:Stress response RCI peptide n=1 Tax=Wallemia hederae TaxID=1540922 RepID=A0A4T0FSY1_9BASI|nr:hypothetical protein E3P99_01393 [Wallemia hederae]
MRGQNGCERTLNGILAIFLPPVSVAIVTGCGPKGAVQCLINVVLYVVLWIPAVIHAWYIIHHYRNGFTEDEGPKVVYVQGAPPHQQQQQPYQQQQQHAQNPSNPPYPHQQQRASYGDNAPQPYPPVAAASQEYSLPTYNEAQSTGQSVQAGRPGGDTKV